MSFGTATAEDVPALRCLWMRCFGDTEDYVNLYMQYAFVPERVFVLREPTLCAMAISFPVQYRGEDGTTTDGAYLYAVCIAPEARGRGLFRSLMEQAEQALAARGSAFVCLRPASEALLQTYMRMGYQVGFTNRERCIPAVQMGLRLSPLDPARYGVLRRRALCGGRVEYPPEVLAHQARLGSLFEARDGDRYGFGAAERWGETVILKEYLGDETLLPAIGGALGAQRLTVRLPGTEQVFALAKPLCGQTCPTGYLAFAFD